MAPAYKLTYFGFKGIAETIRFLFKYGEIEFEDNRLELEDWPKLKQNTPFGYLPLLEHNGRVLGESTAIMRYVAKKVKLVGKDDWEDFEIDSIINTMYDFYQKLLQFYLEQDEEKKKAIRDKINSEICPFYLSKFEAIVQKNNGHLALGRLTWADLYFAAISPIYDFYTGGDTLAKYPNLRALREKVNELPAIKKWIETRPKTEF